MSSNITSTIFTLLLLLSIEIIPVRNHLEDKFREQDKGRWVSYDKEDYSPRKSNKTTRLIKFYEQPNNVWNKWKVLHNKQKTPESTKLLLNGEGAASLKYYLNFDYRGAESEHNILIDDATGAKFGDSAYIVDRASISKQDNHDALVGVFIADSTSDTIIEGTFKMNFINKFFYSVKPGSVLNKVEKNFLSCKFSKRAVLKNSRELGFKEDIRITFFGLLHASTFDKGFLDGVREDGNRPIYLEFDLARGSKFDVLEKDIYEVIFEYDKVDRDYNVDEIINYVKEEMAFIPPRSTKTGVGPAITSPLYNPMVIDCKNRSNLWLAAQVSYQHGGKERLKFNCKDTNQNVNEYYKDKGEEMKRIWKNSEPITDLDDGYSSLVAILAVLLVVFGVVIGAAVLFILKQNQDNQAGGGGGGASAGASYQPTTKPQTTYGQMTTAPSKSRVPSYVKLSQPTTKMISTKLKSKSGSKNRSLRVSSKRERSRSRFKPSTAPLI